jgi:hypothetical protein
MTPPLFPPSCPVCATALLVTGLQCPACGTGVTGTFLPSPSVGAVRPTGSAAQLDAERSDSASATPGRLINLPEPHASLLELFLRVRGNVKDVERELGLSYPTVRARLEEAFTAARPLLTLTAPSGSPTSSTSTPARREEQAQLAAQRAEILSALERGDLNPSQASERLRALAKGKNHD